MTERSRWRDWALALAGFALADLTGGRPASGCIMASCSFIFYAYYRGW